MENELIYRIALSLLPNIGPVISRLLHDYCGTAEAVFKEKKHLLAKIPGVGSKRIRKAFAAPVLERAEKEAAFLRRHKVTALFYTDPDYPKKLHHCPDAPVLLYYKGQTDLNRHRYIGIVGTRSATPYGEEMTRQIIEGLKGTDTVVVSGLAYGIDICAHNAALHCGMETVGVMAHGLDRIYPQAHRTTAGKMIRQGGLLTEYPSETVPDRENFPTRNRIVAGLCDAIVVVEASGKGGALITADLAIGYNRDVFAVPGRTMDLYSTGCNNYIRENKAGLITSANDLIWMMGWKDHRDTKKPAVQTTLFTDLNDEEQRIVNFLKEQGESGIDAIGAAAALPFSRLANTLLQLELKGIVQLRPGKRYAL